MNLRELAPDRRQSLRHLIKKLAVRQGNFLLASGEQTEVYLDVRRVALDSRGAYLLGNAIVSYAENQFPMCSALGGMTLGADPLIASALTAAHARGSLSLHGVIVRKNAKAYGAMDRLVGVAEDPATHSLLAVDDVVTSGGSLLRSIEALRDAGYHVPAAFTVVDREDGGSELLAEHGVSLHSLFTLSEVIS